MKRLGIVLSYDEDGIIYDYLLYFIKELSTVCDRLIVAFNGELRKESREALSEITDDIYERENRGLDCGAYLDVIENYITLAEAETYDEVCLANDTMFGPFEPFGSIFQSMERNGDDVWGLKMNLFPIPHIQSFFLCFRNGTIIDAITYWKTREKAFGEYAASKNYYVGAIEVGLSKALAEKGYKLGAYAQPDSVDVFRYPNILVRYYGFPFAKKSIKSCGKENLEIVQTYMDVIAGIKDKYSYPCEYIASYFSVKYGLDLEKATNAEYQASIAGYTDPAMIQAFLNAYSEVFLYGAGNYGQMMMGIVGEERVRGFIASKKTEEYVMGKKVYLLNEVSVDAPIIVAMRRDYTKEVKKILGGHKNVLYLWADEECVFR